MIQDQQIGQNPEYVRTWSHLQATQATPLQAAQTQACHLDILMKTQGERTKTQEQKTQNSRAKKNPQRFSQNTKNA